MAYLSAREQEDIEKLVHELVHVELARIEKRIENENLRAIKIMNASVDKLQDAAGLVEKVERELDRVVNLVEGFEIRLQEIEAEFGW